MGVRPEQIGNAALSADGGVAVFDGGESSLASDTNHLR